MERELPSYTMKGSLGNYPQHNFHSRLSRPSSLPVFDGTSHHEHGLALQSPYYRYGQLQNMIRSKEDRRTEFMTGDPMLINPPAHGHINQRISPRFLSPQFIAEQHYDTKCGSTESLHSDSKAFVDSRLDQYSPAHMNYSPGFPFDTSFYDSRGSYSPYRKESPQTPNFSPISNTSRSSHKRIASEKDPSPIKVSPNFHDSIDSRLLPSHENIRLLEEIRYRNQLAGNQSELATNLYLTKSPSQHNTDFAYYPSAKDKIQREFAHRFLFENVGFQEKDAFHLPFSKDFESLRAQLMPNVEQQTSPSSHCGGVIRQSVICMPSKVRKTTAKEKDVSKTAKDSVYWVEKPSSVIDDLYNGGKHSDICDARTINNRGRPYVDDHRDPSFEKCYSAPNLFEKVFNIGDDVISKTDANCRNPAKDPYKRYTLKDSVGNFQVDSQQVVNIGHQIEERNHERVDISRGKNAEFRNQKLQDSDAIFRKIPKTIDAVNEDGYNDIDCSSNEEGVIRVANAKENISLLHSPFGKITERNGGGHQPAMKLKKHRETGSNEINLKGDNDNVNNSTNGPFNGTSNGPSNDLPKPTIVDCTKKDSSVATRLAKRDKIKAKGSVPNNEMDEQFPVKINGDYDQLVLASTGKVIEERQDNEMREGAGKGNRKSKANNAAQSNESSNEIFAVESKLIGLLEASDSPKESFESEETEKDDTSTKRILSREERAIQYAMQKFKEMEEKKSRREKGKRQDANEKKDDVTESQETTGKEQNLINGEPPTKVTRGKGSLNRKRGLEHHADVLSDETNTNKSKERRIETEISEKRKNTCSDPNKGCKKPKKTDSQTNNEQHFQDGKHEVTREVRHKDKCNKKETQDNDILRISTHAKDPFHGRGDMHQKSYLLVPSYKGFKDFAPVVLEGRTRKRSSQTDAEKVGKSKFPILVVETVGEKRNEILVEENEDLDAKIAKESLLAEKVFENVNDDDGKKNVRHLSCNRMTGETVLHKAARLGYDDVVDIKIKEGADVNAKDNAGWTALHEACVRGKKEVVKVLLRYGADPNCRSETGIRPLHDAVESNNIDIIRLLIRHGADISEETYSGMKVLQLARTKQARDFLTGYIGDIQATSLLDTDTDNITNDLWSFRGTSSLLDKETDDAAEIFKDFPEDSDMQIEFVASSKEPLRTYNLPVYRDEHTRICYRNYYLLDDVLTTLSLSRSNFFKKHKVELRTLPWSEFVDHIRQSQTAILPQPPPSCSEEEDPTIELVHVGHFAARKLFDLKSYQV